MKSLNSKLVPWTVFLMGLLIAYYPTLLSGFARMQFDFGDARLVNYFLEQGLRWMRGAGPFWDADFFYPIKNVMAYSEIMLGTAPLYGLIRTLGFVPDSAFQVWSLSIAGLNFFAMFVWLRQRFHADRLPAAMGAFLFAFANSRNAQISHLQLHPQFFTVLSIEALYRLKEIPTRSWIWSAVFVISSVLQLYSGFYLGWMLGISLGILCILALLKPTWRAAMWRGVRIHWVPFLLLGALGLCALYPMASHYLEGGHTVGFRTVDHVDPPVSRSWFYLGNFNWLYGSQGTWGFFRNVPKNLEHHLGIGFVTTLLCILGFARRRRFAASAILAAVMIIWILMTTRWPGEIHLWRSFFPVIPGAAAIRALSRVGLIFLIPMAVGLSAFMHSQRHRAGGLLILSLIVMAEQVRVAPTFDKVAVRAGVQRVVDQLRGKSCESFLYFPDDLIEPPYKYNLDAMWAQIATGIPTINGYSGSVPPGWGFEQMKDRSALESWKALHSLSNERVCIVR